MKQESGSLLLWEGHFIKFEIGLPDGSAPHQGRIFVVLLDRRTRQFITAGSDGCVWLPSLMMLLSLLL